jgi:hypothetical protein
MSHYVHSIPGRLRVRAQSFKHNPENSHVAAALLGGLEGVQSVEANLITGSLLIRYEEDVVQSSRILGALVAEGLIRHLPPPRPNPKASKSANATNLRHVTESLSEALPEMIVDLIADKVARRAAMALVSAVI